jgi:hypothetical protein
MKTLAPAERGAISCPLLSEPFSQGVVEPEGEPFHRRPERSEGAAQRLERGRAQASPAMRERRNARDSPLAVGEFERSDAPSGAPKTTAAKRRTFSRIMAAKGGFRPQSRPERYRRARSGQGAGPRHARAWSSLRCGQALRVAPVPLTRPCPPLRAPMRQGCRLRGTSVSPPAGLPGNIRRLTSHANS